MKRKPFVGIREVRLSYYGNDEKKEGGEDARSMDTSLIWEEGRTSNKS